VPPQLAAELKEAWRLWAERILRDSLSDRDGDGFYTSKAEEAQQLYMRVIKIYQRVEAYWPAFLAAFKERFEQFASRDPQFQQMMQELLRGEDFSQPSIELWYRGFRYDDSLRMHDGTVRITQFFRVKIDQVKQWEDRTKIHMLTQGEVWINRFLETMYECYQKVSVRDRSGIFTRVMSDEERNEALRFIHEKVYLVNDFEIFYHRNFSGKVSQVFLRGYQGSTFNLPPGPRKAHMWVCAASESGKTQLIQRMICDDIEHGRSVVVVDSQRDMIMEKLLWLKHDMEVVLIDPEDIEYPPGIALFDIEFGSGREAEDREADVIQCYGDMFSVFGSELTGRQDSLLAPALRLMFTIPNANIYTLIDLFRGENMSRYIEKLPKEDRDFFFKDWTSPQYKANKQQILAKLNIIVQNKTIRRIFANTKRKFDFYSILNRPCVVLINTSRSLLKDKGCMLFGRFMLSQIIDAIRQRANIPERERMTTYIYVDEGKDYRDADAIINTVYECRKYGGHLIFCSQNYGQLGANMASALFSSAIKFVRAVRETSETNKLAAPYA
jgi:hypothetical protein